MENTNKLEIKKYIKLDDGRVLESEKTCIEIYDSTGKKYFREHCGSYDEYFEIIGESDYLHKYYDGSNVKLPGLDVVVHFSSRHGGGYYCTVFDFDEDDECYLDDECDEHSIEDGEVLLGSWYEGGMRFVAKWNSEKKDWELL